MRQRYFFRGTVFPTVAALGLMAPGLMVPGLAQAQAPQAAVPMTLPAGACGQSLGLTHIFGLPVDQAAPAAPVLNMTRHEPRFVEFRVNGPATLSFETSYPSSESADPFLALFDAAGNVLDYDDDSAGNLNAELVVPVGAGTYCAQVRMLGDPPQGPIDVTLDFRVIGASGTAPSGNAFAGDPSLPCGDPARTQTVGRLAPGFGSLGFDAVVPQKASQDWLISVAQAMSLKIATGGDEFDTMLTLRDATRRVIAENDDGIGMGINSLIEETLIPGDYCLTIAGFAGTGGNARLDLSEVRGNAGSGGQISGGGEISGGGGQVDGGGSDGGTTGGTGFARSGPCGDPARTAMLGRVGRGFGSVQANGTVATDETQDWILSLAEPLDLRLDATSDGIDTVLALYDSGGTLLDENDDGIGTSTDSRITRSLGAGDYCLSVRDYFGSAGTVQLAAFEEGVQTGGNSSAGDAFAAGNPCGDPASTRYIGTLARGFGQTTLQGEVPVDGTAQFSADLQGSLDLSVIARSGVFDTVMSIYDSTGRQIAANDDGPQMGTDSLVASRFDAGPICVSLRGFRGFGGAFELEVLESASQGGMNGGAIGGGGGSALASGPCSDPAVTTDIGSLRAGFGTMSFAMQVASGSVSNLRFTVEDVPLARFETVQPDFDTVLELYRGADMVEENDDSAEGGTESLIIATLEPGDYCASVRGWAGTGGGLSLVVSEPDAVRETGLVLPGPDSGVGIAELGALGAAGLSQNEFSAEGESWVMFDLANPGEVGVRAINVTGSFSLGLFDAVTGAQIDVVAGGGGLEPGVIEASLGAGRYAVGVAPDRMFDAGMRRIEISAQ